MSTRCMVFFQEDETDSSTSIKFYQHEDGSPSNVAKDLADFFAKWNRVHPVHPSYFGVGEVAAHFIHFTMERSFRSCVQHGIRMRKRAEAEDNEYWIKSAKEYQEKNRTQYRYSGYRVIPHGQIHDDIEWVYVVTPDRVYIYHAQHNLRGNYNDFEARVSKSNWILVSTEEESSNLRYGRYPERYDRMSAEALWMEEVDKFLDAEEAASLDAPQLSLSC